jgi:hypothetical protein
MDKRQREGFIEPSPRQVKEAALNQRREADEAVVALFLDRLEPAVVNEGAIRRYLERYGPFESERAQRVLDRLLESTPRDLHVEVYLDAIRKQLDGDTP